MSYKFFKWGSHECQVDLINHRCKVNVNNIWVKSLGQTRNIHVHGNKGLISFCNTCNNYTFLCTLIYTIQLSFFIRLIFDIWQIFLIKNIYSKWVNALLVMMWPWPSSNDLSLCQGSQYGHPSLSSITNQTHTLDYLTIRHNDFKPNTQYFLCRAYIM